MQVVAKTGVGILSSELETMTKKSERVLKESQSRIAMPAGSSAVVILWTIK